MSQERQRQQQIRMLAFQDYQIQLASTKNYRDCKIHHFYPFLINMFAIYIDFKLGVAIKGRARCCTALRQVQPAGHLSPVRGGGTRFFFPFDRFLGLEYSP